VLFAIVFWQGVDVRAITSCVIIDKLPFAHDRRRPASAVSVPQTRFSITRFRRLVPETGFGPHLQQDRGVVLLTTATKQAMVGLH
jgi:hypothetical protein